MKAKTIQKLLTAVLTAALLMGTVLSVSAQNTNTNIGDTSSESPSSEESAPVAATIEATSAGGSVTVAGTKVKNTVAGMFTVKKLQGVAVITPLAEVKANLGLTAGQTPYIIAFDTDVKKSALAMNCVNAAAEAMGANVITAINVTLGAKQNGKTIELTNGSAGMVVGLPKTADTTKTYYVVCVQPGGVVTILNDQDLSPATVTFEIQAGLGTYGVIAQ